MPSFFRYACCVATLLASQAASADEAASLSVSSQLLTRQTDYGSSSRLQFSVDALYPTRYGAWFLQDGEAGWLLPAPAGFVSLGLANEPAWSLGGGVSQNLVVARYGFALPQDGNLSLGYASRIGNSHPGQLLVANLQAPLGHWLGQQLSVYGWASLANQERRRALGHAGDGADWRLEQSNLLLVLSHPLAKDWSLELGAGSRWGAENTGGHSAGWQTLLGLSWTLP